MASAYGANVAVTFRTCVMSTTHVVSVVQPGAPDQLVNVPPDAVSVTSVSSTYCSMQSAPQLMPLGVDCTRPVPATVTLSVNNGSNTADTILSVFIVTVQVLVPLQPPPDQPVNAMPASGVAVSTTIESSWNFTEHVAPQLMPAGDDVTTPVPEPGFEIVNVCASTKVALTVVGAFIVTTQVVTVPLHPPPDHPVKIEFELGVAVSVTDVLTL